MIKIKETKEGASIVIPKGIKHRTMLLGIEMMIETIIKESKKDIDVLLEDIKRIYERDNKEE